jgi:hypothetical protein
MLKRTIVLALLGLFILPVDMLANRKDSRRQSMRRRGEVQAQAKAEKAVRLEEKAAQENSTQYGHGSTLAALGVASVAGCAALYKTYKNRKAVTSWVKRKINKA